VNRYVSHMRPEGDPLSWACGLVLGSGGAPTASGARAFVGALLTEESVTPRAAQCGSTRLVADTSAVLRPKPVTQPPQEPSSACAPCRSCLCVDSMHSAVQDKAPAQLTLTGWVFLDRSQRRRLRLRRPVRGLPGHVVRGGAVEGTREERRTTTGLYSAADGCLVRKPAAAHIFIGSVEIAGGWRQRVPFQLRLGDLQGGVRATARHGSRAG
jgi:hypothetical protein